MTKRIFAIFIAVLILALSVPAFAAESFSTWNVAGIYAGDLNTAMSQTRYADAWQYIVDNASGNLATWVTSPNYKTLGVVTYVDYSGYSGEARVVFFRGLSSFDQFRFSSNDSTRKTYPYILSSDTSSSTSNFVKISVRADATDWANGSFTRLYGPSSDSSASYISPLLKPNNTYTQADLYLDQSISLFDTVTSQVVPYPVPAYSGPGTILLQPGNLLIFEKSGGFVGVEDITITAENLPRSPLVGPWTTRNTIKSFPSLPDPSSVFVLPYSEWTAIPGTTDWLGRSTSGSFVWRISQYTDDYAVYLNPIFGTDVSEGGLFGGNQADYNPFNKVLINDVSAYDRIMLVPVINRFGQSYIDYDSGSVIYDVSFNDDGTPEYSEDGESVDSGVANKPGGATSIDDPYFDTVGGILGLLERGAEAIRSLTSGAQSFFAAIRDMFTWLPQEIQTILVSALALVFAVGVIKILH